MTAENKNQMELPFKQSDFTDGITKDEKFNLACDLFMLSQSIQSHDESIFHLVASASVIKNIAIKSGLVTKEQYEQLISEELEKILAMIKSYSEEQKEEKEAE